MVMLYLADRIIQLYEDFEGFCEWIKQMERMGVLEKVEIGDDTVVIKGKIVTGISLKYEPTYCYGALAMAIFGMSWTELPDAKEGFEKVKKWWRKHVKGNNVDLLLW